MTKWQNFEILCNMCSCLCTVLAVSVLYFKKKHWNRLRKNSKIRHFVISSHLFYWHANHIRGILQHFKFESWRIGEFDFWCHEQGINEISRSVVFGCFILLPASKLLNFWRTQKWANFFSLFQIVKLKIWREKLRVISLCTYLRHIN